MKYINSKKIEKIVLNKDNFYVAIDFDRTITSRASMDSWDASGLTLGEDFQKDLDKLYQYYAPIELDYSLSFEEKEKHMQEWYERCMDLYFDYGLTQDKLLESIRNSKLEFRICAKEFLNKLQENNIPVIILSAGIGNVIKQFLINNNCLFENMYIISNFMEFEDNGKIKKFDNSKIIHTLNKNMDGHLPLDWIEKIKNRKYKVLAGDLVEDIKMVDSKYENETIKIGILDKNVEQNLNVFNENFDVVLTDEDANFKNIINV